MSYSSDFPTLIIQNQNFKKKKFRRPVSKKFMSDDIRGRHALFFHLKIPTDQSKFVLHRPLVCNGTYQYCITCSKLLTYFPTFRLLKSNTKGYLVQLIFVNQFGIMIMKWYGKIYSSKVTPLTFNLMTN